MATAEHRLTALAQKHYSKWELNPALEKVEVVLAQKPKSRKALQLKVDILIAQGQHGLARSAAHTLVDHHPFDIRGRRALRAMGAAPPETSLEDAIRFINAVGPSAYVEAAECLYHEDMLEDALALCDDGLALQPSSKGLLKVKADTLFALQRYDAALGAYKKLQPQHLVQALLGQARCHFEIGNLDAAEHAFQQAYAAEGWHTSSSLRAEIPQAKGDLRHAFQFYRQRPIDLLIAEKFGQKPPMSVDLRKDAHPGGRVFLIAEGGPGDEVRLSSLYEDVATVFGKAVHLTCDPRLQSILTRTFPEIRFIPVTRHRPDVPADMSDRKTVGDHRLAPFMSDAAVDVAQTSSYVSMLSSVLPDLRPDRESFQEKTRRFLLPDSLKTQQWRNTTQSPRLKVGLAWRSLLTAVQRNRHYFSVEMLPDLLEMNVDFWVLQPSITEDERSFLQQYENVYIPQIDLKDDIESQAALISCLDLVVSPFTTTGELSAAVGVETILIGYARAALWRRNQDGSDVFSPRTTIVTGSPLYDKPSAIEAAKAIVAERANNLSTSDR